MKTASSNPDSVSIVNITPEDADVGAHHLLHSRRERDRVVVEVVVHAVGDRAVVVERREHLADRLEHPVDALDVEEGLLLAGEGGVGQVLGGRAGTYGEGHLVAPGHQLVVRRPDVGLEVLGEVAGRDRLADLLAHLRQRAGVVGVEPLELAGDLLGQAGVADEPTVGVGRRREPVGHVHAELGEVADHLAERGVLAADLLEVVEAELGEGPDVGVLAGVGGRSSCAPRRGAAR